MAPPARFAPQVRYLAFLMFLCTKNGSPGQIRTGNLEVNSFLLYHWATGEQRLGIRRSTQTKSLENQDSNPIIAYFPKMW